MLRRILLGCLLAAGLMGQTNVGRITGLVTDSSGAAMPGVQVTVLNPQTDFRQQTVTQDSGSYVFTSLPAGTYTISAEKQGFSTIREQSIVLDASSVRTVNLTLAPGAVSETVSVTANAEQVQTQSGDVSQVLDNGQVTNLALNGRDYVNLLRLVPGSMIATLDQFSVTNSMVGTITNGARTPSMGAYVDGVQNLDTASNYNERITPNPDTIAEVRILTDAFAAEYGGNSGAYMNVVIKSGTRDFHGSAFEFLRNEDLDAKNFFSSGPDLLHYNDFGWTLGGPVFLPHKFNSTRDKLFFFWSEEWKYQHQGTLHNSTVPTALERSGDFVGSGLTAPVDPTTGTPFPGEIVPQSRWSVNGPKLLTILPLPNTTGAQNFTYTSPDTQDSREDMIKVDYNFSPETRMSADYMHQTWGNSTGGGTFGNLPSTGGRPGWVTAINLTHSFSPTLLNYISFGASHDYIITDPNDRAVSRPTLGYTASELYPSNQFDAVPSFSITGFTGGSYGNAADKSVMDFDLHDDLTKVQGSHVFKFGARFVRSRDDETSYGSPSNENGALTFNTSATATSKNALADLLLGNFYEYTEDQYGGYFYSRYSTYEIYAQDSWRVNSKLTLNYGLRYSIMPYPISPVGNDAVFLPSAFNPATAQQVSAKTGAIIPGIGNPFDGIVIPGSGCTSYGKVHLPLCQGNALQGLFGNIPSGIAPTKWGNLAPRFGFAYDPFGDGKTAIRGGFGIFYDRIGHLEYLLAMSRNPPFDYSAQVYNGNIDNPGSNASATYPSAFTTIPTSLKVPSVMNYNFNIQRELPGKVILQVAYVGNLGRHLARSLDINQLHPGTLDLPQNVGANVNSLRPYSGYSDIYVYDHGDNSSYNSMQITANRRVAKGLSFGSAFSWSRAMADTPAQTGFTVQAMQNPYDTRADYGQSSINRKFILSVNSVYELPFFQHSHYRAVTSVLGGWVLSGVLAAQSGAPFNVTVSSDVAGIGVASSRATVISGVDPYDANPTVSQWFNTAAFLPVAQMVKGQFGTDGAYALSGPAYSSLDLSMFKNFALKEKMSLQIRGESFNALNHPSWTTLGTTVGTSTFGEVTAASPARVFQFGMKFLF